MSTLSAIITRLSDVEKALHPLNLKLRDLQAGDDLVRNLEVQQRPLSREAAQLHDALAEAVIASDREALAVLVAVLDAVAFLVEGVELGEHRAVTCHKQVRALIAYHSAKAGIVVDELGIFADALELSDALVCEGRE